MRLAALALIAVVAAPGQILRLSREQLIHYTPQNPIERFPDGRPRVPDALLDQVASLTVDSVYET
ncbi:MAG: dimethylmenaquinone methyltransferase, partial [Bryobacteraceae bacterium]